MQRQPKNGEPYNSTSLTQLKQSLNLAHGKDTGRLEMHKFIAHSQQRKLETKEVGEAETGLNVGSCIFDAKYKAAINSTWNLRTKVKVMPRKSAQKKR